MRTTYDAVNEFKGEYFDGECGDENHQDEIAVAKKDFCEYKCGDIHIGSGNSIRNEYWKVIGTRDQFNDLVSKMETNFGECDPVLAAYYRHVTDKELLTKPDKELEVMDIDWSKAPEGTTHYGPKNGTYVDGWYKVSDGGTYFSRPHNKVWGKTVAYRPISQLITKPQPPITHVQGYGIKGDGGSTTPTYTQAMADNGELPSVGMEFMWRTWGEDVLCKMLGVHKDEYWLDTEEGTKLVTNITNLKPLTPPIELIDGKAYQFNFADDKFMYGIYNLDKNILSVEQGTYFDIARVYNIRPLTVEVK